MLLLLLTAFAAETACDGLDDDNDGDVDEGTVCAPCEWASNGGSDYLICPIDGGWDAADQECQNRGWELTAVDDLAESDFIGSNLPANTRYWMGLSQGGSPGGWTWTDGSPVGVFNWAAGQPDLTGPRCGALGAGSGPWFDEFCDHIEPGFVCETQCVSQTWYADLDGDGYGDPSLFVNSCVAPTSSVSNADDCDDDNPAVSPDGTEVTCNGLDDDCNSLTPDSVDADGDGSASCVDCDDTDPDSFPGNPEVCDGNDNDCNGTDDDGLTFRDYFQDDDGDAYGDTLLGNRCSPIAGAVTQGNDCDDTDAAVNPGATEVCNSIDDNCDGAEDEGLATSDWYSDGDDDGFGDTLVATSCGAPAGTVATPGDCDDTDASVNPGAVETCDGEDDDCDGTPDNGLATTDWYSDGDGDGFGDTLLTTSCLQPPSSSDAAGDCDDTVSTVFPGAAETCNGVDDNCDTLVDNGVVTVDWFADNDSDGYGGAFVTNDCSQPPNAVANELDCDDANAAINPDGTETCDGLDQDCDGTADNGIPTTDWHADDDSDGFGGLFIVTSCQVPSGAVGDGTDCDDQDATAYPGNVETCDSVDNDCDTLVDDADDDLVAPTYYPDADSDNYGDAAGTGTTTCTAPPDTATNANDCDDTDPTIYPLAVEACPDGIDNDCDTLIDDEDPDYTDQPVVFWFDQDGDGTGTPADTFEGCSGDQPLGYVSQGLGEDCNDGDVAISPLLGELCDGIDNDCTGTIDDGLSFADFYPDTDGDGFGDPNGTPINACEPVPDYVVDTTDCDDNRSIVFPGNPELCDNLDNDCNGVADDGLTLTAWYPDGDGDGFGSETQRAETCSPVPGWIALGGDCDDSDPAVNPVAIEVEGDGIDNDCDGLGGAPDMTGDTGLTPGLVDSDGDGVPDSIDPDPNSVGDGLRAAPVMNPAWVCGTSGNASGWLFLAGLLALRRRSHARRTG